MERAELERQIEAAALLEDPVRRALYLYVAAQGREVGRAEAARAVRVSRALAAFHLDRLVEESLLEAGYRRLTGRSGPGAGRPAKVYRRSSEQFELTLPPRQYELAARLFAEALAGESAGSPPEALHRAAEQFGERLGDEARRRAPARARRELLLESAESILRDYGFEPYRAAEGEIRLRNCPFHALSGRYPTLVCGMNLSLMQGLLRGLRARGVEASLEPRPGECCVAFRGAGRAAR